MQRLIQFVQEAWAELQKVNWPTQKQVLRYTITVVAVSLAVAIFLGLLDLLFSRLVERFIL